MSDMAKLFWSGRSQAVRLPKEFRFDGSEVRIRREGERVILEPAQRADEGAIANAAATEIARLRALIDEGMEGGEIPWNADEIKRRGRLALEKRA